MKAVLVLSGPWGGRCFEGSVNAADLVLVLPLLGFDPATTLEAAAAAATGPLRPGEMHRMRPGSLPPEPAAFMAAAPVAG